MYIGETNPNLLFCLNDQANTAWFTSTRGVWSNQCHWTIMTGATNILHSSGNLCISLSVCLTIKIFGSQYHWFRFYHVAVLTSKTSCLHWWFYKIILVTHFEPFLIEHIAEYFKMQQDLLLLWNIWWVCWDCSPCTERDGEWPQHCNKEKTSSWVFYTSGEATNIYQPL